MTKGQMEAEISRALTQWEKDFLGRGSVTVKTDILRDMVIVVLKGILTPAEYKLSETAEGLLSIKKIRSDLVESGRDQLESIKKDAKRATGSDRIRAIISLPTFKQR